MIEIAKTSLVSTAPPLRFFERWCDLESHPEWAPSMEYFRLDEPFGLGARGVLKARGSDEAAFVVTALQPPFIYADSTQLDGAELTVHHEARPRGSGSTVTLRAWLDGDRSQELAREWGDDVQRSLETDLASLARLVE